ncbi:MAG: hypothetical protein AAF108_02915 [Planctomycetota bacterium]
MLSHTVTGGPFKLGALLDLGDGSKGLDGTGGSFEYRVVINSQSVGGGPQAVVLGTQSRASITVPEFYVPPGGTVQIYARSPNAADTDVDVTARLFDASVDGANLSNVTLADDAIAASKFDESTAYPLRSNNVNLSAEGIVTGSAVTGTLSTTQLSTNLSGFDNGRLVGRSIVFTSAPLKGESADINAYVSSGGLITLAQNLSEAPINGTTFVIV